MATKKKSASNADSSFTLPPGAPSDMAGWRALYPELSAQRTIDEIVAGLERARAEGSSSVLHSTFEDEVGISIKKQPTDPYAWLCQTKSLWLTNVTPFDDVVFEDVRPLTTFTQLTLLEVSASLAADLSVLRALKELKTLYVRGGEHSDWSWLAQLSQLEVLNVAGSLVAQRDLVPSPKLVLSANTKLRRFQWSGRYDDISHVGLGPQVEWIKLVGQFSDISRLAAVDSLKHLDVRGCQVRDLSPLASLRYLARLDVSSNQVESLSPIEGRTNLALDAQYNCISDLTPYRKIMAQNPERAESWIKKTESTQLKLTTPEARAVYDDWLNLDKWRSLCDVLDAAGDPMGRQIRLRLANDPDCDLPWFWARGTMTRDPSWK